MKRAADGGHFDTQMAAADLNVHSLFLDISRRELLEKYWPRLRGCVELLSDEQVWWRPNDAMRGEDLGFYRELDKTGRLPEK